MSMSHTAVWPAARDSARGVVNALAAGDRVAVVAFDEEAVIEQPLTTDHAAALAAINRVKPGTRGTRYGAGIRAARELLAREADMTGGEIVMVTDLQRSGASGISGLTLPPTVKLRVVAASTGKHGNTAVTGVQVQRLAGTDSTRNRLVVSAQVMTRGLASPRHARVSLTANGRAGALREASLPVDGSTTVTFDPIPLPVGAVRLVVAVEGDSLPADDSFNAVVPAQAVRRVILAVPGDLGADETFYLERALSTGQDPALRIERHNAASLDAATLRDALAVVLYDVSPPTAAVFGAWVHAGGGVVEVAGRRMATRATSSDLVPGTLHGMVDRTSDGGAVLGAASLEHPVFSPFRGGAAAPLGTARFYRYPRITPAADAQVVARFDDDAPALIERQEGLGRRADDEHAAGCNVGRFPVAADLPSIPSRAGAVRRGNNVPAALARIG